MHAGDNRVKRARLQALRREFDWLTMKESEGVNEMSALGSKTEDITVVEKLLWAVLDKILPIVGTY